jgi:hypothetical protein
MNTTSKMALVAALILGSTSMSFARADGTNTRHHAIATQSFQTRNAALSQGPSSAEEAWMDRASREWNGGGY